MRAEGQRGDKEAGLSFEQALAQRGCRITNIDKIPEDLDFKTVAGGKNPNFRIDVLGICTILLFPSDRSGDVVVRWYFNGAESSGNGGSKKEMEKKILDSIDANLESEKEKNNGVAELYAFAAKHGASVREIKEFPRDLTYDKGIGGYCKPRDFDGTKTFLRMDFPNDTVVLMSMPHARHYYVGIYKNGKYYVGNHDMTIHELEGSIG